jgi:hypothetical protein
MKLNTGKTINHTGQNAHTTLLTPHYRLNWIPFFFFFIAPCMANFFLLPFFLSFPTCVPPLALQPFSRLPI